MATINKELKRLSRSELVDIIYQLKKNEEEMQNEIDSLRNELSEQRISISNAGSIADAALQVTNVFSSAQTTADIYLREVAQIKEETEKECAQKIDETKIKVQEMLAEGEQKLKNLKAHYKKEYQRWQQLKAELNNFEQNKKELCEGVKNG